MRKIMFFDIDGTLIPEREGAKMPESTRKALVKAHEMGHLLYVNTGRPSCNVGSDVREHGFDGYVFGCGTMVVCAGQEISRSTVDKGLCIATAGLLREYNAVPMYERSDGVFFDFGMREMPMITGIRESFARQGKNVDRSVDDADFSFDKFIICYDESVNADSLKTELEKDYFWIHRGEGFAEIVPKPCSKASGIAQVLEYHGIPKENAYAVGDSLNDLPMFGAVGTGIAMGNGIALKPYAQYLTDDIDSDGIYNAMEHFGFFEPAL